MRSTAVVVAAALTWWQSAAASGLSPALTAAGARDLLSSHCVETDASSAPVEALLARLKPAAGAVHRAPIKGGTSVSVALGGGAVLQFDLVDKVVKSCSLNATLVDPEATFLALQSRWHLGGAIDDHDAASNNWVEVVSPGGVKLAATFSFRVTRALDGRVVGSMIARVLPAAP